MSQLSARENEVLELLAKGLLQKEIADQLGISYRAVQARIYEKLHVHSRAQAVAKYHGQLRPSGSHVSHLPCPSF